MTLSRVLALLFVTAITVACSSKEGNVELTDKQHALVAERLAPHGQVMMAGQAVVAAVAVSSGRSAESIYSVSCAACHNNGVARRSQNGRCGRLGRPFTAGYRDSLCQCNQWNTSHACNGNLHGL